jgi:hypothetical protein
MPASAGDERSAAEALATKRAVIPRGSSIHPMTRWWRPQRHLPSGSNWRTATTKMDQQRSGEAVQAARCPGPAAVKGWADKRDEGVAGRCRRSFAGIERIAIGKGAEDIERLGG